MNSRKTCGIAVLFSALGFSSVTAGYDLVPLWELRNVPAATDTLYTTYFNDHNLAIDVYSNTEHGVAAWVPCSVDTLKGPNGETPYTGTTDYEDYYLDGTTKVFSHGYDPAHDMNFTCAQPPNSTPIYRLYKYTPQTDHILTTSPSEVSSLEAQGYTFERVEGYVFTNSLLGVLLRRYHINLANGDVEHRYTISSSAGNALVAAGWTADPALGYVSATFNNPTINATGFTGEFNGVSVTPGTSTAVSIQNVVPSTSSFRLGGNAGSSLNRATVAHGAFASNTTSRPAHAVWQQISFVLNTGTLFTNANFSHIPIYLHYASTGTKTDLAYEKVYDGIALVVAKAGARAIGTCASGNTGGQLYIELGAAKLAGTVNGAPTSLYCDSNLSAPLQNNTAYQITFSLDDSANVKVTALTTPNGNPLTFVQGTTVFTKQYLSKFSCPSTPTANMSYCGNPFSNDGFPVANTGYIFRALYTGDDSSESATVSNLKVQWLDVNGNVL